MVNLEPRYKVKELPIRIGELSRITGVPASRLRFYERRGVLPKVMRSGNGYRVYPDTAVKALRLIDAAQQLGFSLNEIRDALSEAAPDFPSRAAMVKVLKNKLDSIERHIKEVQTRRRRLTKLLEDLKA